MSERKQTQEKRERERKKVRTRQLIGLFPLDELKGPFLRVWPEKLGREKN